MYVYVFINTQLIFTQTYIILEAINLPSMYINNILGIMYTRTCAKKIKLALIYICEQYSSRLSVNVKCVSLDLQLLKAVLTSAFWMNITEYYYTIQAQTNNKQP